MIYVLQAELAAGDNISVQSCVDEFFKEETLTDSNEVYVGLYGSVQFNAIKIESYITSVLILLLQIAHLFEK